MDFFIALISIMFEEKKLYDEILKITKNKTKFIIDRDMENISHISFEEEKFIGEIQVLEDKRIKISELLVNQLGLLNKNISISELTNFLDDDKAKRLNQIKLEILDIITELKNVNELNAKLINNSLEYIDFSINLLMQTGSDNNNYSKSGKVESGGQRRVFDIKR